MGSGRKMRTYASIDTYPMAIAWLPLLVPAQCHFLVRKKILPKVLNVRFEVSTAVTMKNAVFCDVAPCGDS
jgi:hypothetical protein